MLSTFVLVGVYAVSPTDISTTIDGVIDCAHLDSQKSRVWL
jgi:hypothetical protein